MSDYTVSDIVNYASTGDTTELESAFKDVLSQKISEKVSALRDSIKDDFLGVETDDTDE